VDIKDLKQIIDLMKRSELTELEIEEPNLKLRLKRESHELIVPSIERGRTMVPFETQETASLAAPVSHPSPSHPAPAHVEEKNVTFIKSPMVGTFYRAASPDSSPFVQIGTTVGTDSVVCIIEAMKVLNEIHSEVTGSIIEVLVENGQAVEYGQPLFKVKHT